MRRKKSGRKKLKYEARKEYRKKANQTVEREMKETFFFNQIAFEFRDSLDEQKNKNT